MKNEKIKIESENKLHTWDEGKYEKKSCVKGRCWDSKEEKGGIEEALQFTLLH